MDHPNIAKVLDAGATEGGRPYFVMELVRGIKITDYCDKNKQNPHAPATRFVHQNLPRGLIAGKDSLILLVIMISPAS